MGTFHRQMAGSLVLCFLFIQSCGKNDRASTDASIEAIRSGALIQALNDRSAHSTDIAFPSGEKTQNLLMHFDSDLDFTTSPNDLPEICQFEVTAKEVPKKDQSEQNQDDLSSKPDASKTNDPNQDPGSSSEQSKLTLLPGTIMGHEGLEATFPFTELQLIPFDELPTLEFTWKSLDSSAKNGFLPGVNLIQIPTNTPERNLELERKVGKCVQEIYRKPLLVKTVIEAIKSYSLEILNPPVSSLNQEQLEQLVNEAREIETAPFEQIFDPEFRKEIRKDLTSEELFEISKLTQRLKGELARSVPLLNTFFKTQAQAIEPAFENSRYKALKLLINGIDTSKRLQAVQELHYLVVGNFLSVRTATNLNFTNLLFFGGLSLVPQPGLEVLEPLFELSSNHPFDQMNYPEVHLALPKNHLEQIVKVYNTVRTASANSGSLPQASIQTASAVRVAFIDSGVDLFKFAHLGMTTFMSRGEENRVPSYDYADFGAEIHMPDLTALGHGSSTTGTFLHTLAQIRPEVLKERRLDLGHWKVFTSRAILGAQGTTFSESESIWRAHYFPIQLAIHENVTKTPNTRQPHIVNMSMTTSSYWSFERGGFQTILNEAPWLWVMASGNDGIDAKAKGNACFHDFPDEFRPAEKILCVGAVERGFGEDMITYYSNRGDGVDIYSYESFHPHCARGTSCSTPAITAFATSLKYQFPALKPEQIKKVIVMASEKRNLLLAPEVDLDGAILTEPPFDEDSKKYEEVPFFNPHDPQMRAKAIAIAHQLIKN